MSLYALDGVVPERVVDGLDRVAGADLAGGFRAHRLEFPDEGVEPVAGGGTRLALVPGEALLCGLDRDDDVEVGRSAGDLLADRRLELGAGQRLVADHQVGTHRTPPWRTAVLWKTVRPEGNPGSRGDRAGAGPPAAGAPTRPETRAGRRPPV